jgi:mutator protein MutT
VDSREYPSGALPGVGAIVVGADGILLVKRDKDPGEGLWSIPGGLIELGETQEGAVIREVREETGIDVEVLGLLSTADLIIPDGEDIVKFHYVLNHYLARALDEETQAEYPEAEVGWFSFSDLESMDLPPRIHKLLTKHRSAVERTHHRYF